MINTKLDLRKYLQADLDYYYETEGAKPPGLRDWFLHNEIWYIWRYIKTLRRLELYENNRHRNICYYILWLYYIRKHKILSVRTGIFAFPNTIGPGFRIYHLGSILISKNANIGKNFTIRPGCVIGDIKGVDSAADIGDDVTLSLGVKMFGHVKIGRGAIINGNSVVMTNIPPYAIVTGNPAKVIGFRMTPEEIIEWERTRYAEPDRLTIESLNKNYEKYYLKRTKEIAKFITA